MLQGLGSQRVRHGLATEQHHLCTGNGDLPLAIAFWSRCNLVRLSPSPLGSVPTLVSVRIALISGNPAAVRELIREKPTHLMTRNQVVLRVQKYIFSSE